MRSDIKAHGTDVTCWTTWLLYLLTYLVGCHQYQFKTHENSLSTFAWLSSLTYRSITALLGSWEKKKKKFCDEVLNTNGWRQWTGMGKRNANAFVVEKHSTVRKYAGRTTDGQNILHTFIIPFTSVSSLHINHAYMGHTGRLNSPYFSMNYSLHSKHFRRISIW